MRPNAALICLTFALALAGVVAAPAAAADPEGNFGWSRPSPFTSEQVVFTALYTDADAPGGVDIAWDFNRGDAFTEDDSGPTAVHTYARSGEYTVAVQVSDGVEPPFEISKRIAIVNRPPFATIAAIPSNPVAGQEMTFVSTSSDPDGAIGGQAWDVDGDGFDDGGDVYTTTTFDTPGTYTVRLQVIDKEEPPALSFADVTVIVGARGGGGGQVIGASTLRLMAPFPVVRMAGLVRKRGIRLRLLSVNAPLGASVRFRCTGRGCPFKQRTRVVPTPKKKSTTGVSAAGEVRMRRFRRPVVRAGAIVSIYVTKPGSIGKYTRFRIRSGRPPARRDRCMPPTGTAPIPCPAD